MTTNNSSTGGYLLPTSSTPLPGGLTLTQFLQTVFVGLSAFVGTLVRPKWQIDPPKQPDVPIDWIAIGLGSVLGDANASVTIDDSNNVNLQRHEELEVQVSVYGPNCYENMILIRDGFQIQQNLEALRSANMGFVGTSQALRIPELVNERWCDRYEFSVVMRREIQRVYPILTFVSASGIIHTVVGNEEYLIDWQTN